MIPHYSAPFGPARAVSAWLSPAAAPALSAIEAELADTLDVPATLVLPSVRTGILLLLKAMSDPDSLVVGPAYTCLVVHEAMALSGARARYVEPADDGFLISAADVHRAAEPGCCIILSGLYGLTYCSEFYRSIECVRPRLRILDMAMGIPDRAQVRRLASNDVALFSFGIGKALCAGGGAVACFQDETLADTIRGMREETVRQLSGLGRLRSDLTVLASVAIRTRWLCRPAGAAKAWHQRHQFHHERRASARRCPRQSMFPSSEWTHSMTRLERRLALRNLRRAETSARLRRKQAEAYVEWLAGAGVQLGFGAGSLPQSHFPVRVPAAVRDGLRVYLRRRGVDAGDEFPFPGTLSPAEYPLTARASAEVLTLPMGEHVSLSDVEQVCTSLLDGLRRLGVCCERPPDASPQMRGGGDSLAVARQCDLH